MKTTNKNCGCKCNAKKNLYEIMAQGGRPIKLEKFKGKVVLIVNTASKCGFTPQYIELESLYKRYHSRGLEIIDIPCNQFGGQSPESDAETTEFCQLNYGTEFPQMKKSEVNGAKELPLYKWLKSEQGFKGFDKGHRLSEILDTKLREADADYDKKSDIKWNFTKFLINRQGEVVARFEPTADMARVEEAIEKLL